jgi:hypothetical protein
MNTVAAARTASTAPTSSVLAVSFTAPFRHQVSPEVSTSRAGGQPIESEKREPRPRKGLRAGSREPSRTIRNNPKGSAWEMPGARQRFLRLRRPLYFCCLRESSSFSVLRWADMLTFGFCERVFSNA